MPFFAVERKRSEEALVQVIQEGFVNGVSSRKVERLAKALGIEGMSASQVSDITRGLDEQVEAFRNHHPTTSAHLLMKAFLHVGGGDFPAVQLFKGIELQGVLQPLA